MIKDINDLISNRKNWITVNRENNFENGIKNLLSNMYPDEAHFIYELLQNAEDKKAKHVFFKMQNDKLIFEHDGGLYDKNQLFTLNDIESITGIGTSTKKDDNTTIGKFGVGFKAVFAYTENPQIYSGDYSFEIQDLVVPKLIDRNFQIPEGVTRFVFPFNSKTKSLSDTIMEIKTGLINIKDNTLLFLKNIESIKYELNDGRGGEFLRIDEKNNQVTLLGKNNEETHWLRFDKRIKIEDEEDLKIKDCTINIAFKLTKLDFGKKEIVPTDAGVSIFFPAEKEVSNLRFVINAPFASTIARDSVRNCKSNRLLINELAVFIKEVLHKISEYGFMQMSFLKVLPNNDDDIPEMYMPLFESIHEEYETQPYFITQSGKLDYLKNIIKAYRAMVYELFSEDDVNSILNTSNLKWLKNPMDNTLESKFINMFNMKKLTSYDILSKKNISLFNVIKTKDNKWFYKLFKQLFREYTDLENINLYILKDFKFIPTLSGSFGLPHYLYYSRQEIDASNSNNMIPNDIFSIISKDDKKSRVDEDVIRVLEKIGVKEFDAKAKIEIILNKYRDTNSINNDQNINDVRELIDLLYNYLNRRNYDNDIIRSIKNIEFVQGKNGKYCSLNNMILGYPYKDSFYELLREKVDIGKEVISEKYNNPDDHFFKDKLISISNKLNLLSDLKICETCGGGPIGKNYYIPFLEEALKSKDIVISAYIWNFLSTKNLTYYSEHKENGSVYYSDLVYELQENSWLPNSKNEFLKPKDAYLEDLPAEFTRQNVLDIITILGIKSRNESNKKLKDSLLANNINIPICDIQQINDLYQNNPDLYEELKQYFDEKQRMKKDIEEAQKAKKKEYVKKEYSHIVSETVIDAKPYLKNMYYISGRDYMVCQICRKNMPFKTKKGFWYFEDVEIFKNTIVDKADEATHISLCPICSAKYKEYIKNNEMQQVEMVNQILSKNNKEEIKISMDVQSTLTFTHKHFFDLKTKLPLLLSAQIKEDIENEQKIKTMQRTLTKEDIHDSYINAEWTDINEENMLRIGYDDFRYVLFIEYKTGIEYFEKITKSLFKEIIEERTNKSEYILKIKNNHFYDIYKIK